MSSTAAEPNPPAPAAVRTGQAGMAEARVVPSRRGPVSWIMMRSSVRFFATSFAVAALAFSADGSRLASAGGDRIVRVWNAANTVKKVPSSGVVPIVDPPKSAKIAYPISTFTYAVVPTSGNKQAALLKSFINFDISTGQSFGPKLDFVPLPKVVAKADKAMVGRLS